MTGMMEKLLKSALHQADFVTESLGGDAVEMFLRGLVEGISLVQCRDYQEVLEMLLEVARKEGVFENIVAELEHWFDSIEG